MADARSKVGRRKPRGVQEAVDGDDDVRQDLFDGHPPAKSSHDEKVDLESMTLEQRKDHVVQGNTKALDSAIAHAAQATQIADKTLSDLDRQKEQLKRSEQGLDEINASMSRSERLIKGMKSIGGAVSNWVSGAPKHEKSSGSSLPSDKGKDTDKDYSDAKKNLESIRARTTALRREGMLNEYSGLLRKAWNERYFVLANGSIQYFKSEQSFRDNEGALAKMTTDGIKLKFTDDICNGRQFCMTIVWPAQNTSWLLSANSDKEKRDWLSIIRLMDRSLSSVNNKTATTDPDAAFRATRIQKPRDKMTEEEKFLDDIDRAREDEDAKLDQLGDLVEGLRFRAQDLGSELEAHNQIITRMDGKLDTTNARIKKNRNELTELAR